MFTRQNTLAMRRQAQALNNQQSFAGKAPVSVMDELFKRQPTLQSIAKMGPPAGPTTKGTIERQETNRSSNSRINRLPGMAEIAKGRQKMAPLISLASSKKDNQTMLPPTRTSRTSATQPKPPAKKAAPQKSL